MLDGVLDEHHLQRKRVAGTERYVVVCSTAREPQHEWVWNVLAGKPHGTAQVGGKGGEGYRPARGSEEFLIQRQVGRMSLGGGESLQEGPELASADVRCGTRKVDMPASLKTTLEVGGPQTG